MSVLSVKCRVLNKPQSHDIVPCAVVSVETYGARGISPTQALTTLRQLTNTHTLYVALFCIMMPAGFTLGFSPPIKGFFFLGNLKGHRIPKFSIVSVGP